MRKDFTKNFFFVLTCILILFARNSSGQGIDTLKNKLSLKDRQLLGLSPKSNPFYPLPNNIKRIVEYDAINNQYVVKELIGDKLLTPPQYLTVKQYERLLNAEIKARNWRSISTVDEQEYRRTGIIPPIIINNKNFEKIFGGNTIDIQPRGQAEITLFGRHSKNENPLFNERQRSQINFDFNQRIQMDLVGQIGTKLKIATNYNTEAQFDFENQIKLEYTGNEDEIIQKIEVGNVSMPLSSSLITGSQALFGVKTQLQFGRLNVTSIFTQQKSQSREIRINNGAQQNEFSLSADNYEVNRHYFIAQYFKENYNKFLSNAPNVLSPINITKIEVWITNKSGNTVGSRDVLAFMDLGENSPYNTSLFTGGGSALPAGTTAMGYPNQSNNLLQNIPAGSRFTNRNDINQYFQSSGATDNFAKLTYARRLAENEYTFQPQLGYISLNNGLNNDEVLAVAYKYTYNGVEYQVGEFSTDISFEANNPKVLYAKLLKNETTKVKLPTWGLMMKNIYSIGGYQISSTNFNLNIFRTEEKSGVEIPAIQEGKNTQNKRWIQLTQVDRLNLQQEKQPDGVFDFVASNNALGNASIGAAYNNNYNNTNDPLNTNIAPLFDNTNRGYITIDPANGRIIFPVVEPFGKDLAKLFDPATEQALIEKYSFTALYDSTKTTAQQQFQNKNRYLIKGNYQSEVSSEFSLNAINVPQGSVKVFAGTIPLQEGIDFTVDYFGGRVSIINNSVLMSGNPIRITTENNELFGLQQKTLFGTRLDYRVNNKLNLGGTIMNLTEKPLTQKVNFGEEPISNTMWGLDLNYNSPSRFLTKLVDKIPLISTKEPSSITFNGEFAQLLPGHPRALDFAGSKRGVSYIDDFESTRSVIDLKGAIAWQISGTPQLFPESQLHDNLAYGYNRSRLAFYNIDPIFYMSNSNYTPANIKNNLTELSNHYVREVAEQEVFPFRETPVGQTQSLQTLNLNFYPMLRGPYNFSTSGFNSDGTLQNPKNRWAGMQRKIETNDFESMNIEFIEFWVMDPFVYKTNSQGGDLYFNLGNISEDILKDGRKSLENGLPADGDPNKFDETNWGRVPKLQPVIQAFDSDPNNRKAQDVGLDGLSNANERTKFSGALAQIIAALNPTAGTELDADPASDDYRYYRGPELDQMNAGILKRYEKYNGVEGNSKTTQQSQEEFGLENSASTSLPDGEDINRDNNMNQADEYFEYKVSMRPADLIVGQNYVTDKIVSPVRLANGQNTNVAWYQFRIPISQYNQKVGNISDFKSIRFIRMFLTNFADTAVMRFAKLQLVRGDWRQFNPSNNSAQLIVDPALNTVSPDQSTLEVASVNIEENGKRSPIPYVTPPGILRERDYSNYQNDTRLNEQALAVTVKDLRDGYGRATFKTAFSDFRAYKKIQMFIHAEAVGNNILKDNDVHAFLRLGTDYIDNYYEYNLALKVTQPNTADPYAIWPEANNMEVNIEVFQRAKLARNHAKNALGQPWPINVPFEYREGNHHVIIKGQPDLSKVRVYMLGVKNPLKGSPYNLNDDGLDKSVQIWFNELRLTDFDNRGGWAATARMNAKLADFADVNISGSYSTVGFGPIESRVSERNKDDNMFFDVNSNIELGKFLPKKSGVKIPVYVSYSKQISKPQYNPSMPDIELKEALNAAPNKQQRDSILNYAQDMTTRRSIVFNNVHKERTNAEKPVRLWDVENLSLSYSYTDYLQHDYTTEQNLQKNYRGSLAYTYSAESKNYKPFDKIIKSNVFKILKDFNISPMPNAINFRIDFDRFYAENKLRNNDPLNALPLERMYSKNFRISRVYGIGWKLTNSLTLDFNATNYSIVDEPYGKIEGLKRDTLWQNLKTLGRTTDYNHMLNIGYNVPIHKLPGLDWINLAARYGTNFYWQTEPLSTLLDPNINLGNTVQNAQTVQLNPTFNLNTLYNKFNFYRGNAERSGFTAVLIDLLTSVKNINAAYTKTRGTFMPGYNPKTSYFGIDKVTGAPGWGFVFGSQRDIRDIAARSGWLSTDELQTQMYVNTYQEDLSFTGLVEPIKDLRITLVATKNESKNYSSNFKYDLSSSEFRNLGANTMGSYNISFISIGTAFKDNIGSMSSSVYRTFLENKSVISRRLGQSNPNSNGTINGFADGYNENAQEVVNAAFLSAYTGKSPEKVKLRAFPTFPLPNWRMTYNGLTKLDFIANHFSSVDLRHSYSSVYSINNYNSLLRYEERGGFAFSRDAEQNFLPQLQFNAVSITERFSPLIGIDTRFKNNLTATLEFNKSRILGLSLLNSQLAQLAENNIVVGLGWRTTDFRFPFGWFQNVRLENVLDFRLDMALRDMKTVIYRGDLAQAEVSAGSKNLTVRPSIDYELNKQFNLKVFYDTNITKPYTSQTFNTSNSNFGFSLRFTFN